jgi:hypothetical protein
MCYVLCINKGDTQMTKIELKEIDALVTEALLEITRINNARGETVFNPAATSGLRYVCRILEKNCLVRQ